MTLASIDFKTEFAVDMTCQSCVDAVSQSLKQVQGIDRYDIDLLGKTVVITGRAPPSRIFKALKATERQVIVRGTSTASADTPSTAAVSILESPIPLPTSIASTSAPTLKSENDFTQKVFGICRFVQIAPKLVLMDLTVRLPAPAKVGLNVNPWSVYISSTGNMVDPPTTTGKPWLSLGSIIPDKEGYGDLFQEVPGELGEWVGRGCVVQAEAGVGTGRIFAGVVARSAGAWGNDKTVCACSGRTMWEEGRDVERQAF